MQAQNNTLSSNYNTLLSNYNTLQGSYNALQATLSDTTRLYNNLVTHHSADVASVTSYLNQAWYIANGLGLGFACVILDSGYSVVYDSFTNVDFNFASSTGYPNIAVPMLGAGHCTVDPRLWVTGCAGRNFGISFRDPGGVVRASLVFNIANVNVQGSWPAANNAATSTCLGFPRYANSNGVISPITNSIGLT